MNTQQLVTAEIALINRHLAAHDIQARARLKLTMIAKSSFIAYGLQVAPGESVRKVEGITRELSNALTNQRVKMLPNRDVGRCVVRLRDYPLALEVPHPSPSVLSWESASIRAGRYCALIGRSYSQTSAKNEWLDLERHHHSLVAAMSGGGKSTLMRMALLSLAFNTSPADLRICLIDLKNDDLTPFRSLPHVVSYSGDVDTAAAAIAFVHGIKQERIESQRKPFRLLLVIDELAELSQAKDGLRQLGSILSTGRSLGINVWAGTQYPSAQAIGSIVAASFTTRLVGMVDGKNSAHVATKRAGSGAELLQTPGDFLRVDGAELTRMKAYHIDQEATSELIERTVGKWNREAEKEKAGDEPVMEPATSPATASYSQLSEAATRGGSESAGVASYHSQFPIRAGRALTESEAQAARRMAEAGEFDHLGKISLNRAMMTVYGSRGPERAGWIREVLGLTSVGE